MPSQTPQITIHHPQFFQSHQHEDDDHDEPHQEQPPTRPTRPRRRPPCGTGGHRWFSTNLIVVF